MKGKLPLVSWMLYDLANQFFAVNVVSLYFARWLVLEKNAPEILYSISFGISMFFVSVCAPFLGTIADMRGKHRLFLILLTLLSVTFTTLLGFSEYIFLALIFFAIANFGCQEAVVFYNALMVNVSPKNKIGLVSGLGRAFGYTGAILALCFTKPIIEQKGYQATFIITGILFLFFALPCMIFVRDRAVNGSLSLASLFKKNMLFEVVRRLKSTMLDSTRFAGLLDFFKAAFFSICAINVIILFMSVYVSKVFGLTDAQAIHLFVFSTLFALVSSFISGFISDYIGYKRSMMGVLFLWGVSFLGGALLEAPFHWLVGALVGISLGSTWVIFRVLVIRLVPEEKIGEVFGLFNFVGYFGGIVGSLYWGGILLVLSRFGETGYRLACLSLIVFIAISFVFLLRIPKTIRRQ
ncbi:MAG: MFS transporter [Candidatus Omnitrophota bacterium]|nr:MAG: MFS transporter [Candidatus Omnitrophota bacterium]